MMGAVAMERSKNSWGAKKAQEVNDESRPENQGGVGTKPATDTEEASDEAEFAGAPTAAQYPWSSCKSLKGEKRARSRARTWFAVEQSLLGAAHHPYDNKPGDANDRSNDTKNLEHFG